MILLLDSGNSRLKWVVLDADSKRAEGALEHSELARLRDALAPQGSISRTVGTNVAGAEIATRIAQVLHGVAPAAEWQRARRDCCGVTNLYDSPAQLGADRWAALIGARTVCTAPCVVVTAGTATTVDLLDRHGVFQGGLILPGETLMRQSLAGNTAQLPYADGRLVAAPRNTADAIVSGCLNAQAGAIERMFARLDEPDAVCLLNGGAAASIAPALGIPLRAVDNLVLRGLEVIARCTSNQATDGAGQEASV